MEKNLEKIKNSRILITGGLGLVGSAIARRLLKESVREVVIFDVKKDLPSALQEVEGWERLRILAGDIRNPEHVRSAVEGCDYVFHQAALRVTFCEKEPRLAHEVMVDGTFNVVAACAAKKVKKVIFASSAIIYGEPVSLPLQENHPLHDTTLYGVFKASNEMLLRSFWKNQGLDYLVLRYFNIYGPGMNLFGSEVEVLIRWLDRIDQGLAPLIFGDGQQTLDWISIHDIAEANWLALLSDATGEALNICTGRETSLLQLLELLLKASKAAILPEFREARAINHVPRRFGSFEKAHRLLGFTPRISLEQGIAEFVEWRKSVLDATRPRS